MGRLYNWASGYTCDRLAPVKAPPCNWPMRIFGPSRSAIIATRSPVARVAARRFSITHSYDYGNRRAKRHCTIFYALANPAVPTSRDQDLLAGELGISPIVSQILINRGITTPDDAKKFLFPSLEQLHNPFLMKDMDKAVDRVTKAIELGEKIMIYGDYDVDGTTSVSMVPSCLSIRRR